jgi:hypothetical protein
MAYMYSYLGLLEPVIQPLLDENILLENMMK